MPIEIQTNILFHFNNIKIKIGLERDKEIEGNCDVGSCIHSRLVHVVRSYKNNHFYRFNILSFKPHQTP